MFEWVQEADKKGVEGRLRRRFCHSGGMERSASAPGVRFRKMETPTIAADQLHLPPPEISKLTEDDFDNVTFVAAVAEDKLTPEVIEFWRCRHHPWRGLRCGPVSFTWRR